MMNITLTDQTFSEQVLDSQSIVLVDFWAEWCMPCQMIAPILQELAEEYEGAVVIGKLDVDANPLVSTAFSIEAIPTLMLFKKGKVVQKFVGVQPKVAIEEAINRALK